ncbi:helix-turn-helix domain-containing protein, partial [Endozoicomonas sp. SM1973]
RVLHVHGGTASPLRYKFEELCDALLPVSRWELESKQLKLEITQGSKTSNLRSFSGRRLAWDRLNDLRKLVELRGGVVEGWRMIHMHWHLNFLLLSGATNSAQMWYEAIALAKELDPNWSYYKKELSTLYRKARAYEAGERIEFNGKQYPPLYTPKNDHLLNLFEITNDEQKLLRTIISENEAHRRAAEREAARRRANGAIPRDKYEAKAAKLREQVVKLRAEGLSQRKIATKVGVSQQRVQQIL